MGDNMIYSSRIAGINVDNNVFDSNFVMNIDNQFSNITDALTGPATSGFTISRNVFIGVELHGSSQRPNTRIFNNTFYKSAGDASPVFVIGNNSHGTGAGSVVHSNAFIGNGMSPDTAGTRGWYSIVDAVMGEPPNFNYVAGPPSDKYPAKQGFVGAEPAGINGGDPRFRNINDPLGPDGVPFTLDDGLKPLPGSPLCGKAENGLDIGAYSCDAATVLSGGDGPLPSAGMSTTVK
jgi:hypothetical protein